MTTNTITIEKMINGGLGLGRAENGQIILTQGSLPDERIKYSILEKKKNFIQGKVTEILTPHPQRKEAPCPYYSRCGGCDLQHCHYQEQLRIKDSIIHDLLERQGIATHNLSLAPCLPSPGKTGYRQRIRLQIDEKGRPGFYQFRSNRVLAIESCLIAEPALNRALAEIREQAPFSHLGANCKELELLLNPESGKVICLFHQLRKPRPKDVEAAHQLLEMVPLLEALFFKGENFPLSSPGVAETHHLSCELHLSGFQLQLPLSWEVGGFCQVNLEQNNHLVEMVVTLAQAEKEDSLLDLYCGMGNFSLPLAHSCSSVLGVEGQASSIRSAKHNSSLAGLTNTHFVKSPIHAFCEKLQEEKQTFDLVVIDPPRQGVPGLSPFLAKTTRKRLVYISCDPATLCRDLKELTSHGFTLSTLQPVDMFPQTHHIETVALLEKN